MKISVVTTLYYSEIYIEEFYNRLVKSIQEITVDYEIIFVNDGSPDKSLNACISLFERDKRIKIVDLSRNFGHHKAVMTGLSLVSGEYIFLIDSDLEENPEWVTLFWEELNKNKNSDVVYGVQSSRKGYLFEKLSGGLFFGLFNLLSNVKITNNVIMARLMTRRYVDNLIKFTERELAFVGLCELTGFQQTPIFITKTHKGKSTYNLSRKFDMAINFIVSFSSKPLIFIFYLGMFITILSSLFIATLIIKKLSTGLLEGWTSVMASVWFIGGVVIFLLGIIGIYLSKIFIEVKQRPYTIIKKIYSFENNSNCHADSKNHNLWER